MRPRRTVLTIVTLAGLLAVPGCTAGNPGNGSGGPTSTGPHSSAQTAVPTLTTGAPTPDAAQAATLLGALKTIDIALATDQQEAIDGAVTVCRELRTGTDAAAAVHDGFGGVTLDATQADAVQQAVTSTFCPAG